MRLCSNDIEGLKYGSGGKNIKYLHKESLTNFREAQI